MRVRPGRAGKTGQGQDRAGCRSPDTKGSGTGTTVGGGCLKIKGSQRGFRAWLEPAGEGEGDKGPEQGRRGDGLRQQAGKRPIAGGRRGWEGRLCHRTAGQAELRRPCRGCGRETTAEASPESEAGGRAGLQVELGRGLLNKSHTHRAGTSSGAGH